MTTATRNERWRHGRHLAGPGVYIAMAAGAVMAWFPALPTFPSALITAVLFTIMAANMLHQRELCERCIANMPLDPGGKAERNRRVLKAFHLSRYWFPGVLVAVLAASLIAPRHSLTAMAFGTLLWVDCIATSLICDRHRHLQPWCPYCPRNDGGDPVLTPDAPPSDRKPVPA